MIKYIYRINKEGDIMSYVTIEKCVKDIQQILLDDFMIPIESAKAINEQLKLILLLSKKDEEDET